MASNRTDILMSMRKHPITGDLATVKSSNAIVQSFKNLLLINKYERGFNTIGVDIKKYLFQLNDDVMRSTLSTEIKNILNHYETDVEVADVSIYQGDTEEDIVIVISYTEYNNPNLKETAIPIKRLG